MIRMERTSYFAPFFYVDDSRDMHVDQIFALILFVVATILPEKYLAFTIVPEAQLILGTLVVLFLILRDAIGGLILGLAVLVAYFRVYSAKFGVSWRDLFKKTDYPMASLVTEYITPEHLHAAQSNVVDNTMYGQELKGIEGVYGEDVYGAQGLDTTMPGYGETPLGEEIRDAHE